MMARPESIGLEEGDLVLATEERRVQRRHAVVTQADVARAIRATQAAGLTITRVVARADGVAIETADAPSTEALPIGAPRKRIKL